MKKKRNYQLNNNGSTLVIVLIMAAFISILSMVVTTAAMTNLKMKLVNKQSTKTFYTAEDAVDEIYAALGKVSMECFDEAYNMELSRIVKGADTQKTALQNSKYNEELRIEYMDRIIQKLFSPDTTVYKVTNNDVIEYIYASKDEDVAYFLNLLNSYLEDKSSGIQVKSLDEMNIEHSDSKAEQNSGLKNYTFTFKNCVVEYESENGYFSNITFNGSVGMPDSLIDFITISTEGLDTFTEYALIGNTGVVITGAEEEEGGAIGNVSIASSIYAGKGNNVGLTVDTSASVNLYNGMLVSAGDINVLSNAAFSAGSEDIWCDNIVVSGANASVSVDSGSTTHVSDDLQVDGNHAKVIMAGQYFGYGYVPTVNSNPHSSMSAVIINGKGANLDFSRITTMVIAGNAYIDYSKKMLTAAYGDTTMNYSGDSAYYNTGNSIDYIGAQEIYLVPTILMGEKGDEPNPNASESVSVNLTADSFFGYSYLNPNMPYITKTIDGKVYYYLNFLDADSIQQYVKAVTDDAFYEELKSTETAKSSNQILAQNAFDQTHSYVSELISVNLSEMDSYITGLNNATVHSNGALVIASRGGSQSVTASLKDRDSSYNYSADHQLFSRQYKALKRALVLDETLVPDSAYVDQNIYANLVDNEQLKLETGEKNNNKPYHPDSSLTDGKLVYVINNSGAAISVGGTGDITDGNNEGIIIASGDVIVKKSFNGLILAGGKITVQGNVTLSNAMSGTTVRSIIERNDVLKAVLKGWSTLESNESNQSDVQIEKITYKELVQFSQWRKYEEAETQ